MCAHPEDLCEDSNFAAVILSNGSLLGVGRGSVYTATDWSNVSSYTSRSASGMQGEDPSLWLDDRPGVVHMLRHTARNVSGQNNDGLHFFSEDGGLSWNAFEKELAYSCWMNYTDGSSECMIMRERPHLIFDRDGKTPVALSTAAMRGPYTEARRANLRSFTLVQQVGVG